ncbi:MAG: DUF937 domain-containing protein [Cyanobacteria bacterium P01_E01_bin.6]
MGLFDQVVGALSNPNQQASTDQLSGILNVATQLVGNQGSSSSGSTQALMSVVGQYVRSSLQETSQTQGRSQVASLVEQFAGTNPNTAALQAVLSPQKQQQLVNAASQRTGLDASMIQSMLPVLVPLALNFLKTGASSGGTSQATASSNNSVLDAFLDSDGDGDVDLGDALSMAGRFLRK